MSRIRKWKFVCGIVMCLTMVLSVVNTSYAKEDSDKGSTDIKTIKVGWYNSGKEGHSNAYDYYYEYLQALSQYTNWEYEYVEADWDECLDMLAKGDIDLLGFTHKTEEREEIYGFPELPMAVTSAYIVVDDSTDINNNTLSDLNGKTVGVVSGIAFNDDFDYFCTENNLDVKVKVYDSLLDIPDALENGDIYAAVVAEEDKIEDEQIIATLASKNQYFVTNIENKELLRELDEAMLQVNTYCPYLNSELYQKYIGLNSNGTPIFTMEEQNFISNHPQILVKYDSGWPPIEYYDDKSEDYKGISPDLFKLLSEKCGIEFVYEGSTSGQVLSDLENDEEKNVLTTISYNYEWAETHNVYITQPFITSGIVKLGKHLDKENPIVAINEKAYFTFALKNELDGVNTVNYPKQIERLEAVRTGKADYTFVTENQANYYRSIPKYSDLDIEKMYGYDQKICISITKNSDKELMTIISKSLACISHDEMTAIVRDNTINTYTSSFTDRMYMNRIPIVLISLLFLSLLAVVWARFMILKSKRFAEMELNRTRTEFLSHVSHDIRTPLNAIIGITSLAIEETNLDIKQDYLKKVNDSSEYLLGLINDTLDMSKIENGKLTLHNDSVNFDSMYRLVYSIIEPKAKEKHIKLSTNKNNITDDYFIIDKLRFEQILLNLLNNAVKFTPEGGIVSCDLFIVSRTDTEVTYRITIADTGVGISEEFMEKLFVPFEQERNRLSVENGGTGLGLSIVKSIIDIMGGTITCKSKKDVGTEFTVELTSRLATEKEIEIIEEDIAVCNDNIFSDKHILLAEDNSMNVLVATKLLEKKNMIVKTVGNGIEAIEAVKESEENYYDVILMDIHMPLMDGLKASKAIRELERKDASSISIIALSANAYEEDRKECFEAGMNDHVAKPIVPDQLYNAIKRAIQHKL